MKVSCLRLRTDENFGCDAYGHMSSIRRLRRGLSASNGRPKSRNAPEMSVGRQCYSGSGHDEQQRLRRRGVNHNLPWGSMSGDVLEFPVSRQSPLRTQRRVQ